MTIPRVIHQIWVGPNEPPWEWIDTWRGMDGWEYQLWREADLASFPMMNRRQYRAYIRDRCWHGASDVARVDILAERGGIFMDADIARLLPLDGAPWLNDVMFAVHSPDSEVLANGIMGCVPRAELMLAYREAIGRLRGRSRLYPPGSKVGPHLLTRLAGEYPITVVEPGAFFAEDRAGEPVPHTGVRYGTHHWLTTRKILDDSTRREPPPQLRPIFHARRWLSRRLPNSVRSALRWMLGR